MFGNSTFFVFKNRELFLFFIFFILKKKQFLLNTSRKFFVLEKRYLKGVHFILLEKRTFFVFRNNRFFLYEKAHFSF